MKLGCFQFPNNIAAYRTSYVCLYRQSRWFDRTALSDTRDLVSSGYHKKSLNIFKKLKIILPHKQWFRKFSDVGKLRPRKDFSTVVWDYVVVYPDLREMLVRSTAVSQTVMFNSRGSTANSNCLQNKHQKVEMSILNCFDGALNDVANVIVIKSPSPQWVRHGPCTTCPHAGWWCSGVIKCKQNLFASCLSKLYLRV